MSGFDALISHMDQFAHSGAGVKPMGQKSGMTNTFDIMSVERNAKHKAQGRRAGRVAAGLALMVFGFSRPSFVRVLLGVYGGTLVFRGLTDESLLGFGRGAIKSLRTGGSGMRSDLVDESSQQSFPASDAPSFSGIT
jgi:hypothetical protein